MNIKPIKGRKAFSDAIKGSRRVYTDIAMAFVSHKNTNNDDSEQANGDNTFYYGILISKKTAKRAVVRNRIKRLIRESLKIYCGEQANESKNIKTFIVNWRKAPLRPTQIKLNEVLTIINELFDKANKIYEGNKIG